MSNEPSAVESVSVKPIVKAWEKSKVAKAPYWAGCIPNPVSQQFQLGPMDFSLLHSLPVRTSTGVVHDSSRDGLMGRIVVLSGQDVEQIKKAASTQFVRFSVTADRKVIAYPFDAEWENSGNDALRHTHQLNMTRGGGATILPVGAFCYLLPCPSDFEEFDVRRPIIGDWQVTTDSDGYPVCSQPFPKDKMLCPLTPEQEGAFQGIMGAFGGHRIANRLGGIDSPHLKARIDEAKYLEQYKDAIK